MVDIPQNQTKPNQTKPETTMIHKDKQNKNN